MYTRQYCHLIIWDYHHLWFITWSYACIQTEIRFKKRKNKTNETNFVRSFDNGSKTNLSLPYAFFHESKSWYIFDLCIVSIFWKFSVTISVWEACYRLAILYHGKNKGEKTLQLKIGMTRGKRWKSLRVRYKTADNYHLTMHM